MTAGLPDAAEQLALRIGPAEPVLRLTRLTRLTLDAGGRPLQADLMTMPAHRQRLRDELRIG